MGIISWSANLEKRVAFPWQFFSLALALIFGAITIYTEFVRETSPMLQIEVLSNEPVLDVREKLPDLEVLYQSQDIAKSGKTLSVLIAKIANRGSADLLSSFYDSKAPITLSVTGGTLVRADITETSNDYLRRAATLTKSGSDVTLSPVILEKNEWFSVKVLALHDIDIQPSISVSGKIAGQHSILVVAPDTESTQGGFWHRTFWGGLWTQAVRLVTYPFGLILLFGAVMIPSVVISEALTSRRRRKLLSNFKNKTKIGISDADDFIFEWFQSGGLKSIQRITNAVADPDRLQIRVGRYLEYKKQKENPDTERTYDENEDLLLDGIRPPSYRFDFKKMIESGFIEEREGKWGAVAERLKVATALIDYVELVDGE